MIRPFPALAALALSLTLAGCSPSSGPDAPPPRTLSVNGEGFVFARPDLAIVTVGVVTQGTTAGEALAANTERMTVLFKVIAGLGIENKDVQTSNFSVTPRYASPDPENPRAQMQIVGYDASNDVTIQVRKLDKLGDALDAFVSAAGANNLRGVSFDFADVAPLMDEARKKAAADAKRKAALYAEGLGVALGPVQSVSEAGGYYPKGGAALARGEMLSAAVPMAAGESKITASVNVTYELN